MTEIQPIATRDAATAELSACWTCGTERQIIATRKPNGRVLWWQVLDSEGALVMRTSTRSQARDFCGDCCGWQDRQKAKAEAAKRRAAANLSTFEQLLDYLSGTKR